ncbi:sulfatase [Cyclobacterium sp.]|uniref:sulfatase n=1 Tax=Cyclobacterium sp. TaxID=1966343 RepID=UPI0019CEEDB1|nr:sulfatase [Cyclobacterium sp.]MBD3631145.1 sulfatase [Cyclobacterium sp.]
MTLKAGFQLLVLIGFLGPLKAQETRETKKMNVLFIASDDLNNGISGYGHEMVKAPNLERLAKRGVQFNKAYCQYPQCSQSRVSIMTGLRPDTTQVFDLKTDFRDIIPTVTTLPELFMENGYFSARVGKIYHYGVPGDIGTNGLDDAKSWNQVINPIGRDKREEDKLINLTPNRGLGSSLSWLEAAGTDEEQTDGMVANEAIRLMQENQDKPFFIAAGFYRPHCPYIAPKKYFDMYPLESISLPDEPVDHLKDIPEAAFWTNPLYWGLDEHERKQVIRAYYAAVTFIDAQVGKLLDALEDLGLAENTIVVFWSDHGYHLSEHGQWKKQSLFEESARVPLMIAAPGKAGNSMVTDRVVELLDLYPTLAALCDLAAPEYLQGNDISPLLENPNEVWDHGGFTQVRRNSGPYMGRTIRTERWRYIEWDGGEKGTQLYDHDQDPREYNNLAGHPDYQEIQSNLKKRMDTTFR